VKCAPNAYCAHGGRSKATFACVNGPYGPKWVGHKPDCRLCMSPHGKQILDTGKSSGYESKV
jgi:hypothetical protein